MKADQAERQSFLKGVVLTKGEIAVLRRHDSFRYEETKQILFRARSLTGEGFAAGALLMQHGSAVGSFEIAHELSVCASLLGQGGSLPALAEDRFLRNLKRPQRFGSQFGIGSSTPDPIDEQPPTAVTDSLRKIFFLPTLKQYKTAGGALQAFKASVPGIETTAKHRMNSQWVAAHSDPHVGSLLHSFKLNGVGRSRVLELYTANRLVSDADLCRAAEILDSSGKSQELLLAHELAAAAVREKFRKAIPVFMRSWDRFLVSIGRKPRYSRGQELPSVKALLTQK